MSVFSLHNSVFHTEFILVWMTFKKSLMKRYAFTLFMSVSVSWVYIYNEQFIDFLQLVLTERRGDRHNNQQQIWLISRLKSNRPLNSFACTSAEFFEIIRSLKKISGCEMEKSLILRRFSSMKRRERMWWVSESFKNKFQIWIIRCCSRTSTAKVLSSPQAS